MTDTPDRLTWDRTPWPAPVPIDVPGPDEPPVGPVPLPVRVAQFKAFVRSHPSPAAAAAALGVSPGTLRRNLRLETATHEALDVIWEGPGRYE